MMKVDEHAGILPPREESHGPGGAQRSSRNSLPLLLSVST